MRVYVVSRHRKIFGVFHSWDKANDYIEKNFGNTTGWSIVECQVI